MSDKKAPSRGAKKNTPNGQAAEAASAANLTENAAKPAARGKKSSVAPTTPPAGSGATSAAADAATTSTATKSGGRGTGSQSASRTASAGRSTGGTRTSKRESVRKTPETPVTDSAGQTDDRDERIRRRAYELWEAEGWPHGREQDHWAQAERELMGLGGAGVTQASPGEDRAGVVAPPAAGGQPGASEALGGTPSAIRTAGRSRRGKA